MADPGFTIIKDSYRTFSALPGGINLWHHLAEREKALMHEAQGEADPLKCMAKTQRAAMAAEIRNYLDGMLTKN